MAGQLLMAPFSAYFRKLAAAQQGAVMGASLVPGAEMCDRYVGSVLPSLQQAIAGGGSELERGFDIGGSFSESGVFVPDATRASVIAVRTERDLYDLLMGYIRGCTTVDTTRDVAVARDISAVNPTWTVYGRSFDYGDANKALALRARIAGAGPPRVLAPEPPATPDATAAAAPAASAATDTGPSDAAVAVVEALVPAVTGPMDVSTFMGGTPTGTWYTDGSGRRHRLYADKDNRMYYLRRVKATARAKGYLERVNVCTPVTPGPKKLPARVLYGRERAPIVDHNGVASYVTKMKTGVKRINAVYASRMTEGQVRRVLASSPTIKIRPKRGEAPTRCLKLLLAK